jgi:hypothetical protein
LTAEGRSESREDRLARNEALIREANERVEEVGERAGLDMIDFICECGDAECTAAISLTEAEYEQIRADLVLFAILPGHAIPENRTRRIRGRPLPRRTQARGGRGHHPSDRSSGLRVEIAPACAEQ